MMITLSKINGEGSLLDEKWRVEWTAGDQLHYRIFATTEEGVAFMVELAVRRRDSRSEVGHA